LKTVISDTANTEKQLGVSSDTAEAAFTEVTSVLNGTEEGATAANKALVMLRATLQKTSQDN
jgi:hypothetical protein